MTSIYLLSLRQLRGRWRVIGLLAIATIPLVPAIVSLVAADKPLARELDDTLINGLLGSAILPIIVLILATPVFGNELEDKTLSNLMLTPMRRWQIVAPKLAAAVSVAIPLVVLSGAVSVFLAFEGADIGGSGSRMRALIAKRIQATVIHFDQVPRVQQEGNYKVMLVPAEHYNPWVNDVVYTTKGWLEQAENRATAVTTMKAIITASRKANADFGYYKDAFLEYATIKGKDTMPEETMRAYYDTIAHKMGVWPADNAFKAANIEALMPYYKAAGALGDEPIDLGSVVDESIVEQAVSELG